MKGGIGNSMHQYATSRALSLHNHAELYVDKSFYNTRHKYPRQYSLNHFCIEAPISKCTGREIREKKHCHGVYDPKLIRTYEEDVWLNGYFQSEKYFKDIRDVLLGDFMLKSRLSYHARRWYDFIKECDYPVALHIRRGDYVTDIDVRRAHGLLPMEYYHEATEIVRDRARTCAVIVFTDDPVWVLGNTSFFCMSGRTFKNVVVGPTAAEDIYLMSLCKGAVIANSSFSWWGSWLQRPGGIVVAPNPWSCEHQEGAKDILPEEWIKIDVKYL